MNARDDVGFRLRFATPIVPFHRPNLGEEEIAAVVKTMRTRCLSVGPKIHDFQTEFASTVGARYAIAVNSGTAALHLALDSLDLPRGAQVITSTMTFAATAAAIIHAGAHPVLADVSADTLNLDPSDVARKITARTAAILPVHFAGHPAPMTELRGFASAHGLRILEDAAHALAARYRGRAIGTIGDLTAFSFSAGEDLTTGDGGMVTTSDAVLADRMRVRRLHGISWDSSAERRWLYDVTYPGFKYNMGEIAAAMGLVQLRKLSAFAARRRSLAAAYTERLADVAELMLPTTRRGMEHAWHLYAVRLRPERLAITRDALIERLRARGIGTGVHCIPLHRHSYYRTTYGLSDADCPVASKAAETMISLPLYTLMSEADVDYVAETLRQLVRSNRR